VLADWSAIELRKTADGSLIKSVGWLNNGGRITAATISPGGRSLAVGSDGWLRLYDLGTLQPQTLLTGQWITSVAFSRDGKTLAAACEDRVLLVDIESSNKAAEFLSNGPITSLEYQPEGNLLAVGDTTGCVGLWNPRTCQLVRTIDVPGTLGVSWVWPAAVLVLWGLTCRWIWKRRHKAEQETVSEPA
jgi:WD40 repeat protein